MSEIVRTIELFVSKDNQPICTFFEYFYASNDPDYSPTGDDLVYPFCHMAGNMGSGFPATKCLGDYCKCPLAQGKAKIEIIK